MLNLINITPHHEVASPSHLPEVGGVLIALFAIAIVLRFTKQYRRERRISI